MAKYNTNSLGFKLQFNGPDTVEDYDRAAGKSGACLEDAVDNTIYRGTLPEWQEAFADAVGKLTGVSRGTDTAATERVRSRSKTPDKVKDVPERPKAFIARATANMPDADKTALTKTAQEVADGISVDPSPSKRQAGPSKDLLAKADSILTLPQDQIEAKVTKFLSKVDGFDLEREDDGKPEQKSLARLIGQYLDALLAEEV